MLSKTMKAVMGLAVGAWALAAGAAEKGPQVAVDRLGWDGVKVPEGTFTREQGAIMGWFGGPLLAFNDKAGKTVARLYLGGAFPSFDVLTADGTWQGYRRRIEGTGEGDSFHMAVTWRPDGTCRFFMNGQPFENYFTAGERTQWNMASNFMDTVVAVVPEKGRRTEPDAGWTDFRLYGRTLANHEVKAAYRARMPFDFVCVNSVFPADRPTPVSVTAAPGGTFMLPNAVASETNLAGTADFTLTVERISRFREDAKSPFRVTRTTYEKVAEKALPNVRIARETLLATDPVTLPAGDYRVRLTVQVAGQPAYRRTRNVFFARPTDRTGDPASDDEWRTTALLFEKTYRRAEDMEYKDGPLGPAQSSAGAYLELDGTPATRMGDVLHVPPEWCGRPLLLEIDWPDDKPRAMGLYLYPEGVSGVRDRLQQGIQAGREFPSTGRMQTMRCPVFTPSTNFLVEARTLVAGWPAAVAALRVYALDPAWPRLRLNLPEGLEGRRFGHVDEDQTFYNNLNVDADPSFGGVLDRLVQYFNYTGQNAFVYPILRYYRTFGASEGVLSGNGMFPTSQGQLGELIAALARNGIAFTGKMSLYNAPDAAFYGLAESDLRERGALTLDRRGLDRPLYNVGSYLANPANPAAWELVFRSFDDIRRHYGTNGLSSVAWDGFGTWHGLDFGYDDWTVNAFAAETGTGFPSACEVGRNDGRIWPSNDPQGRGRAEGVFLARYGFLTATNTPAVRARWLAWRAARTTAFYRELASRLRAANPAMRIYVHAPDEPAGYVDRGVDAKAVLAIPGIAGLIQSRSVTNFRWKLHRGYEEDDGWQTLYAPEAAELARVKRLQGSLKMLYSGGDYWETFTRSLDMKRFPVAFQDADVKPWGRWWLMELAYVLAKSDVLELCTGQQPLYALGREREAREWAKAYRALPALDFTDMGGVTDPVAGRCRLTKNGLYFYVVNIHHGDLTAVVDFGAAGCPEMIDLSSGARTAGREIALKPYQLRSFLIPRETLDGRTRLGPLAVKGIDRTCYDARFGELAAAQRTFDAHGIPHAREDAILASARQFVAEGRMQAAYNALFRKELNRFVSRCGQMPLVVAERKLMDRGIFRINCGTADYTTIDGDLFFPDVAWNGDYGKRATQQGGAPRKADAVKATKYRTLYETEAFAFDGYSFNVGRPGRYRVTLYLKAGWKRDFRPDWWIFSVAANGKVLLDNADLYVAQGADFDRPYTPSFEVVVGEDGRLDLDFTSPPDYYLYNWNQPNSTTRLLNGLTVERLD